MANDVLVVKNVSNSAWIIPVLISGTYQFNANSEECLEMASLIPNYQTLLDSCQYVEGEDLAQALEYKVVSADAIQALGKDGEVVIAAEAHTGEVVDPVSELTDGVTVVTEQTDEVTEEPDTRPEHIKLAAEGHEFTAEELNALNAQGVREVATELQVPVGNKGDTIKNILAHIKQLADMKDNEASE